MIAHGIQKKKTHLRIKALPPLKEIDTNYGNFTYRLQDVAEDLERYRPGGYYPMHIGDELAEKRYKVVHKLGFGSYSTVWLARDELQDRYVALKIVCADGEPSHEISILRHLRQCHESAMGSAGDSPFAGLLDHFILYGPNGQHTCLVTEVAGCSINSYKPTYGIRIEEFHCALLGT